MFIPGLGLLVLIACVILAGRYAAMEDLSGTFWALMSLLLWIVPAVFLPVGFGLLLLLQVALLVLIRMLAMRQRGY